MSRLEYFTDGACRNNGRDGAKGGIGIWSEREQVSLPLPGRQTNNAAEQQAINEALKRAPYDEPFTIKTDSKLSVDTLNDWGKKWQSNGGRLPSGKPPANWDIIKDSMRNIEERKALGQDVKIEYVPGHKGNYGNERAHDLAQQGAERNAQSYDNQTYSGGFQPSSSYPQDYYDDSDKETYSYAQGSTRDDSNYVHLPSVRIAEPNEDQYSGGARGSSGYAEARSGHGRGTSGYARGSGGSGYAPASTGYAQASSGYVEARSGYAHADVREEGAYGGGVQARSGYAQAEVQGRHDFDSYREANDDDEEGVGAYDDGPSDNDGIGGYDVSDYDDGGYDDGGYDDGVYDDGGGYDYDGGSDHDYY